MANIVYSFLRWLREGYPEGISDQDYIPLVAVLRRRLGEEEVVDVCHQLAREGLIPPDSTDIGVGITKVTDNLPLPQDVARVENRLRAVGWTPTAEAEDDAQAAPGPARTGSSAAGAWTSPETTESRESERTEPATSWVPEQDHRGGRPPAR